MKPSFLKHHLESKHTNLLNKELEYFERLLEDLKNRKNNIKHFSGAEQNANALKAFCKVSHLIAKSGKNHTVCENLILPVAVDIFSCMLGEKISRRINDMACDTKEQLVRRIRVSPCFGIQLDENTNVAGLARLIVFLRGIFQDEVFEDLLFCKTLKTSTKGGDIFKLLDSFFSENHFEWKYCMSVCINGAKAMSGHITELVGFIKTVSAEYNKKNLPNFTELKTQMAQHLNALKIRIRECFPPSEKQYDWIRDPFDADAMDTNLTTFEKEQLLEVSCDPTMKNKYLSSGITLLDFWICIGKEQKELSSTAVKFLVGFSTTY
ncbi:Hypothetical protein CINCED_3A019062 [Cinara cedri]|uniref:Uncharacterized protein n=1 Tax=Cinara cedri TaxID=506608 RepID=A0A5E4NER0_9HEMI|nr:Hypothetical protein CINCED_3A019062 [Cinara cedri]